MKQERIKELMEQVGMPDSLSLYVAFNQIINEVEQECAQAKCKGIPSHVFRELVNALRDTALKYHDHQSLRERMAGTLRDYGVKPGDSDEIDFKG